MLEQSGAEGGFKIPRQYNRELGVPIEQSVGFVERSDRQLISAMDELDQKRSILHPTLSVGGFAFRNEKIAAMADGSYTPAKLRNIENFFNTQGAYLPIARQYIDGIGYLSLMDATPEKTGDSQMSNHLWIRDQTKAARCLIDIASYNTESNGQDRKDAKQLLLSTLHLMSTPSQLQRFSNIIHSDDQAFKDSQDNWPQIYLGLDNLKGERAEKWRHKQDAWQMLAFTTFDALDKGIITQASLKENHKTFLASVMPFMESVDFIHQENSGSWEELPVKRTSVLGIETALLDKIRSYSQKEGFEFLAEGYSGGKKEFTQKIDSMIKDGCNAIAERFPFESPEYPKDSPEYREADAALLYLLDYDVPQLLVKEGIIPQKVQEVLKEKDNEAVVRKIEKMVFNQVRRLSDGRTNGIRRYGSGVDYRDTYQGTNFHTNKSREKILTMKDEIKDPTERFIARDEIIDEGPTAAWTHFVPQIAGWAARRYLQTGDESYYDRATKFFNRSLSTLTGFDEHTAALDENGIYKIQKVKPYQMTECWVTSVMRNKQTSEKREFVFPSPDTPLNWGTMNLRGATRLLTYASEKKLALVNS